MRAGEIYHEEIGFIWGWIANILFFGMTVLFLVLYFVQITSGPIGENPAPDWLLLLYPLFFLIIGIFMVNFIKLTISADASGITAAYGRFRYFVAWDNIESVELDPGPAILHYGGWGIRFAWRSGGSVIVYNTANAALLLMKLKRGKRAYFGFSTRHPEEVKALINSWKK